MFTVCSLFLIVVVSIRFNGSKSAGLAELFLCSIVFVGGKDHRTPLPVHAYIFVFPQKPLNIFGIFEVNVTEVEDTN